MAVVAFAACDACAEAIGIGEHIVVIYTGTLRAIKQGRAIVTFESEEEGEPVHQHGECHQKTHSASPSEGLGLIN